MKKLEQAESPFMNPRPAAARRRGVHWIKPQLVGEVEFTEWTSRRALAPSVISRHSRGQEGVRSRSRAQDRQPAEADSGPTLTNPDKVLYPEVGRDQAGSGFLLRVHRRAYPPPSPGRPIMMKRCPDGAGRSCFYQSIFAMPLRIHYAKSRFKRRTRKDFYTIVDDLDGLLWLVQMGVLEIHVWDRVPRAWSGRIA
jgi:bifunctional non-homologous end joining protein LigD